MSASVQDRIDLVALEAGLARFGSRQPGHSVAILDVVGADTSLATADDATQEEVLAGRAQFLNAQTAPFQVLVRAEPVDLDGHVRRVRARAESLAEPLASVARDYAAFVQLLAHQRTLLERHCYVVLPDVTPVPAASFARRVAQMIRPRHRVAERHDPTAISGEISRRLSARCEQVARQLGRSGLR